jgi:uncharacterized metal-binding protein YceD (DUF177 family)
MPKPLVFPLAALQEEGKARFEGPLTPDAFEVPLCGEASLLGPVSVSLEAVLKEGAVWLLGKATGRWELECCRCLAKVPADFSVRIETELEELPEQIDGLDELRQSLILAVPTQPYCRKECLGLCSQCGVNRNEKDCGHVVTVTNRFKITRDKRN